MGRNFTVYLPLGAWYVVSGIDTDVDEPTYSYGTTGSPLCQSRMVNVRRFRESGSGESAMICPESMASAVDTKGMPTP